MKNFYAIFCIALAGFLTTGAQPVNFKIYDPSGGFLKIMCSPHKAETTSYLKNNKAVNTLEESDLYVKASESNDTIHINSFYTANDQPAISYTLLHRGRELQYVNYSGYEPNGDLIGYAHHINSGKGIVLVKEREEMGVEVYRNGNKIAQYGVAKILQDRLIVFPVGDGEKLQGVLNMNGDMLIPVQYRLINLSENVFVAKNTDEKVGAFDINGKPLIPFEFDNLMPQTDLVVTWVNVHDNDKENYGLYEKSGTLISNPVNAAFDFAEGPAPVVGEDGTYGFVDSTGKMVTNFEYKFARKFSEGLAAVANQKGEYGFIDKTGNLVVPYKYYNVVMNFEHGRAKVSESRFKKAYEIDRNGNKVD